MPGSENNVSKAKKAIESLLQAFSSAKTCKFETSVTVGVEHLRAILNDFPDSLSLEDKIAKCNAAKEYLQAMDSVVGQSFLKHTIGRSILQGSDKQNANAQQQMKIRTALAESCIPFHQDTDVVDNEKVDLLISQLGREISATIVSSDDLQEARRRKSLAFCDVVKTTPHGKEYWGAAEIANLARRLANAVEAKKLHSIHPEIVECTKIYDEMLRFLRTLIELEVEGMDNLKNPTATYVALKTFSGSSIQKYLQEDCPDGVKSVDDMVGKLMASSVGKKLLEKATTGVKPGIDELKLAMSTLFPEGWFPEHVLTQNAQMNN